MEQKNKYHYVQSIFCGALVLLLAVILAGYALGVRIYAVQTGSMEPDLPVGSLIVVKPAKFDSINEGDVITFEVSGSVVTHRVAQVDRKEMTFVTKGDMNTSNDASAVDYDSVIGRLWISLKYVGYPILLMGNRAVKTAVIAFFIIIIGVVIVKR